MTAYYQNYINGQFVDGGAGHIDVTNPANGELNGPARLGRCG